MKDRPGRALFSIPGHAMNSKFQQRLKRLHDSRVRSAEASAAAPGDGGRVFVADDVPAPVEPPRPSPPASRPAAAADASLAGWEALGATLQSNACGEYLLRVHDLADSHRHGDRLLRDCRAVDHGELRRLARRKSYGTLRPDDIAYLDIETAGLGQGEGMYAFCVGIGFWLEGGFRVEQYLMRGGDDEPGMLHAIAARLEAMRGLGTFNGRRFDVDRLTARFRHQGMEAPFGHLQHADLLPYARKQWPGPGGHSLGALEARMLGFTRVDDVPGRAVPALWRRYLRTGQASLLAGVLEHNRLDVVSMPALLAALIESLDPAPARQPAATPAPAHTTPPAPTPPPAHTTPGPLTAKLARTYALHERSTPHPYHESTDARPAPARAPGPPRATAAGSSVRERLRDLREGATALIASGHTDQAAALLFEMVALSPDNPFALDALVHHFRARGDHVYADHFAARLRASSPF